MNILVVGPHPDDQEIGMGGTIARLADQGHDVLLLDMTDGCPTPVGDRATRLREADEAAAILRGPGRLARVLLDLPNRVLVHGVENRHRVAGVIRSHQSQVVFLPYPEDAHPDHLATTRIVEDARFDAKLTKVDMPLPPGRPPGPPIYPRRLIYYYCSHLRIVPQPSFIMDTSETASRKARAVQAYRSQFEQNPANRGFPDKLAAQDAYFGSRINTSAGEPFWVREPLGLSGLEGLTGMG